MQSPSQMTSLLFSRTYITKCSSRFCLGRSFHNIPLLMYNAVIETQQCILEKLTHRFLHTVQPTYAVGLVTTGLSQSTATLILFLHPSALLFLLSSFNLNSACFPQCDVHRSLFCVLCLSVIVSLLLFCSLALFFFL